MMWQTQTTIEYPFALRPASIEEAGLFYSQMDEAEDAVLGTVGHIRMDFGASGKEFYHTWWPHNGDQFNTGEFKDELQKFVDMLRADGPLTNLASMRNYCYQHGGMLIGAPLSVPAWTAKSRNWRNTLPTQYLLKPSNGLEMYLPKCRPRLSLPTRHS